jgi:hypothetical protein
MNHVRRTLIPLLGSLTIAVVFNAPVLADSLSTLPAEVHLKRYDFSQQVLVTRETSTHKIDATREAVFVSSDPKIATVDKTGLIQPVANGQTAIKVSVGELTTNVTVKVTNLEKPIIIDFQNDIQPIFTAGGCNAGACHGKARGQNGFQLSLLGFDSEFDYAALTKEARGRRIFLPSPEQSLLLLKPTGIVPHGGGQRLKPDGADFRSLKQWIVSGLPRRDAAAPELTKIVVSPTERIMQANSQQQTIVTAHYDDGSTRDVTRLSGFQSNESAIAAVDDSGLIRTSHITGEVAVMARYMGMIEVIQIAVPLAEKVDESVYSKLPKNNYIDELVWKKLQRLNLTPSAPAGEGTFLRRAYIDIIGRVPDADEVQAFLDDKTPGKREKLIDFLLEQPEYADHWANKWADLLRPNPYRVGIKTVLNYDNWIRNSFRKNKPYDQFVRELLTAKGGTWRNGAVTLFRDRRSPDELTPIVSQLFLGIRLECAKCHHHPNEVWGQDDFFGFAAYFNKIGRKGTGLSPPISGSEEFFFVGKVREVKHPLTGATVAPKPLFGEAIVIEDNVDPRDVLADWVTSNSNPFFRQVIANRIWMDMMSRGLVEPVDDLRASNPPSNPELLEALALDLRDHKYDLKHLIRRIANSYVYSLSSLPNDRNTVDTRNYSRFYRERLRAEVLLDSVSQITGVEEKFSAMPPGSNSRQLWSHRITSLFLDAFGRPDPNQDPPCERVPDTTIVQALHLMNSQSIYDKVTKDAGIAAELASSDRPSEKIVDRLYLSIYARYPKEKERAALVKLINEAGEKKRQIVADIMWAMLNTPEFVFKH